MNKLSISTSSLVSSSEMWLAHMRKQISGEHSRAARIWKKLKPHQREIIIFSAGLPGSYVHCLWRDFSRSDMRTIRRGIRRLFIIKSEFERCKESDFIPSAEWPATGIKTKEINSQVNYSGCLEHKAQLVAELKNH